MILYKTFKLKIMRRLAIVIIFCFLTGCKTDSTIEQKFYMASDKENVGLLALTIVENRFYGHYKIQYSDNIFDSGDVDGAVIGDTLKGRYKYISYGGREELRPFVLLKRGNTFIMGNGIAYTYMNIPYYSPESIEFKDSNFQFHQINSSTYEKIDLKFK